MRNLDLHLTSNMLNKKDQPAGLGTYYWPGTHQNYYILLLYYLYYIIYVNYIDILYIYIYIFIYI